MADRVKKKREEKALNPFVVNVFLHLPQEKRKNACRSYPEEEKKKKREGGRRMGHPVPGHPFLQFFEQGSYAWASPPSARGRKEEG